MTRISTRELREISQRGDTLVEVMLALSVLSMVVVGCMNIMNQSNLQMMDAVERTAVRSSINSQTELLNYVRDHAAESSAWNEIMTKSAANTNAVDANCTSNDNSFYLSASNGSVSVLSGGGKNSSGKAVPGNGVWIDAANVANGEQVPYVDFYVKACWTRFASDAQASSTTVIRLYDPSGGN